MPFGKETPQTYYGFELFCFGFVVLFFLLFEVKFSSVGWLDFLSQLTSQWQFWDPNSYTHTHHT